MRAELSMFVILIHQSELINIVILFNDLINQ